MAVTVTVGRGALLVGLLGLAAGCDADRGASPAADAEVVRFTDGAFELEYPSWPEAEEREQEALVAVGRGGSGVWVYRFRIPPRLARREVRKFVARQPGTTVLSDGLDEAGGQMVYRQTSEGATTRVEAGLTYCGGSTYVTAVAGVAGAFDTQAATLRRVLSSATCSDPAGPPALDAGRLGIVANPAHDDYATGMWAALRTARTAGAQIASLHRSWRDIEPAPETYEWEWMDNELGYQEAEGFATAVVVNVIHTAVRGPVPADLEGAAFDDPRFIRRFSAMALAMLDRYAGQVAYFSIGNEVNDYFVTHRDEMAAYRDFFTAARSAIRARHPNVQVGLTFAYHDAQRQGAVDIVPALNVGDFTPYTLYLYGDGFTFDRSPAELEAYVDEMLAVAGDRPIALAELGWNTAASLGGSERDQAEFVREAFRILGQHRDRIEYMMWFTLHDGTPENCRNIALSFIPHRPDLAADGAFMSPFTDFICYLGLRGSDGSPKPAWSTWVSEARRYNQRFAPGG